jgi:hypothetical protein
MDRQSRESWTGIAGWETMKILVSSQWQGMSPYGYRWHSEAGLRDMVGLDERGDPARYREGRSLLRRGI